jgi:hypothetical protein
MIPVLLKWTASMQLKITGVQVHQLDFKDNAAVLLP